MLLQHATLLRTVNRTCERSQRLVHRSRLLYFRRRLRSKLAVKRIRGDSLLLFCASVITTCRQSLSLLARTIQNACTFRRRLRNGCAVFLSLNSSLPVAGWIYDRGVRAIMRCASAGGRGKCKHLTGFVSSMRGLAAALFLLGWGIRPIRRGAPRSHRNFSPPRSGVSRSSLHRGATSCNIAPPLIAG